MPDTFADGKNNCTFPLPRSHPAQFPRWDRSGVFRSYPRVFFAGNCLKRFFFLQIAVSWDGLRCFSFGCGEHGKLGLGHCVSKATPQVRDDCLLVFCLFVSLGVRIAVEVAARSCKTKSTCVGLRLDASLRLEALLCFGLKDLLD